MSNLELVKQLREQTGVSIMACKKALEDAGGDISKASELLKERGAMVALSKKDSEIKEGLVYAYIHGTGKSGAMIELACETDFVSRSEDFKSLAHNIALQVVSMNPSDNDDLLKQPFIKDTSKTIESLINDTIGKLGENIVISKFSRFSIGG